MTEIIHKPKLVAFDIGNVLCHVVFDDFINWLLYEGIVESKEVAEEFLASIQHPQDLGLYNIKQGFRRFYPQIDNKTIQTLHDIWLDVARPSEIMLNVVEELIDEGWSVSLLSNIGFDHADYLRHKCNVFKKCNQHFSCEVGARKPAKLFYQSFLLQYGWSKDVMFFDDRQENIKAAEGYLTGVLFDIENYKSDQEAATAMRTHLGL